ncbi:hypothetical protein GTR02_03970 [Kineococcus sp. R8]|uniref:hypothetical protein n=1 Tax=Kineococcus siccus TaxID=2696567 RepID=UPI0014136033|nr:hypothetical protein [Kineococcus siccus]NAZ80971.1 hypothetical protein [Kineococcus siccus]
MPDLQPPVPPAAQEHLRQRLEQLLDDLGITDYRHQDRFWESENGKEAVHGWGTVVHGPADNEPVHVWFDGLDEDIAISTEATAHQPRRRSGAWYEWCDLTQLDDVLDEVMATLRRTLTPTDGS